MVWWLVKECFSAVIRPLWLTAPSGGCVAVKFSTIVSYSLTTTGSSMVRWLVKECFSLAVSERLRFSPGDSLSTLSESSCSGLISIEAGAVTMPHRLLWQLSVKLKGSPRSCGKVLFKDCSPIVSDAWIQGRIVTVNTEDPHAYSIIT